MNTSRFRATARSAVLCALGAAALAICSAACTPASGSAPPRDLEGDCRIAEAVFAGVQPILIAKCAAAADPLEDGFCLAQVAGSTAIGVCYASAARGESAAVDEALGDLRQARASVPVPIPEELGDGDTTSPDVS